MKKQSISAADSNRENAAIILAEQEQEEANRLENLKAEKAENSEVENPEEESGSNGSGRHQKWRSTTVKIKAFFEKVAEYRAENPEVALTTGKTL